MHLEEAPLGELDSFGPEGQASFKLVNRPLSNHNARLYTWFSIRATVLPFSAHVPLVAPDGKDSW